MFAVDNDEFFVWFQLSVVKLLERASRQHMQTHFPKVEFLSRLVFNLFVQ